MRMTNYLKKLTQILLRDYSFYHIYGRGCADENASLAPGFRFEPVEKNEIENSKDGMIVEQAWYHGQSTHAYACFERLENCWTTFFLVRGRLPQKKLLATCRSRSQARSTVCSSGNTGTWHRKKPYRVCHARYVLQRIQVCLRTRLAIKYAILASV